MKIRIKEYNEIKNEYVAKLKGVVILFDPFVSGILNGDNHDRAKIDSLIGRELELDMFQIIGGAWLLTKDGEKQLRSFLTP